MTKYVNENENEEKTVKVRLATGNNQISFVVGDYIIFILQTDGTGYLPGGIPKDNNCGLQINEESETILI